MIFSTTRTTGHNTRIRILYIGAAKSHNGKAARVAIVLGKISPNKRIRTVIIAVAHQIANHSSTEDTLAKSIAILVAKAAISVFTRLLITNIVIKNLSVLSLSQRSLFALVLLHFLISDSIKCLGIDMIAISLPAENAEKERRTTKIKTIDTSIRKIPYK